MIRNLVGSLAVEKPVDLPEIRYIQVIAIVYLVLVGDSPVVAILNLAIPVLQVTLAWASKQHSFTFS